jgi:membrane-associated phospholipid phosphatase
VHGLIGSGKIHGTALGYNPYSAMPSLHVAWALIMGITVCLLARNPLLRAVGVLYPVIVTFATIVTGNHYVMDVIGAAGCVALALPAALLIERRQFGRHTATSWLRVP